MNRAKLLVSPLIALAALFVIDMGAASSQDQPPIRVYVNVDYGERNSTSVVANYRDQLISFFRRELRALDGIALTEHRAASDVSIIVLGLPNDLRSPAHHAITVGAFSRCELPTTQLDRLWSLAELGAQARGEEIGGWFRLGLMSALEECRVERYRTVHIWGNQIDLLIAVRGVVASIDARVIEPLRN